MSLAQVSQSHVFGFKTDVKNNVFYLNESSILYCAGSCLVLHNLELKTQKFLVINEGEVTCLAVSPGENVVAIAVRQVGLRNTTAIGAAVANATGDSRPHIIIVDLHSFKKKRNFTMPESQAKEFVDLKFSNDGKYLIAQSADPDWNLNIFNWDKSKLLASTRSSNNLNAAVNQIQINPYDLNTCQVSVVGNGLFRIFRFTEGVLKSVNQFKIEKNCLCHTWANDQRIVIGTEDCKILIFESAELVLEVLYSNVKLGGGALPSIQALFSCAGGLVIGTSAGSVTYYETTDDVYMYKKSKEVNLEKHSINHLALSPGEESAIISASNSQMYSLNMTDLETSKSELKCERLGQAFHFGSITGMDTCVRKPLIATCSADRSVRVWNFLENSCEVVMHCVEEPLSITLHPSGLYILVAFVDCVRMMTVLIDEIRLFWEGPIRGCRETKFSNGGQHFFCIQGPNIQIISTWTFESICALKGHTNNVKSAVWSSDDSRLLSFSIDGTVIEWNVQTQKKNWEVYIKNVVLSSVAYGPDGRTVYIVGNDGFIREVIDGTLTKEFGTKQPLTQIVLSKSGKYLFVGTTKGSVRAHKFPLLGIESCPTILEGHGTTQILTNVNGSSLNAPVGHGNPRGSVINSGPFTNGNANLSGMRDSLEVLEFPAHTLGVTKLRLAFDDQFLFSCSEDGTFWSYRILGQEKRKDKEMLYSDEILVTKSGLRVHVKQITDMKQKVEDLRADNESQLRTKDVGYNEKLRDVTDKYMSEIDSLKELMMTLETEKSRNESMHRLEFLETKHLNRTEIEELISAFSRKMAAESEKFKDLEGKIEALKMRWEYQMKVLSEEHGAKMNEARVYYDSRLKEKQNEHQNILDEMSSHAGDFNSYVREVDSTVDTEIIEIMQSYETKLKDERDSLVGIREENTNMRNKFDKLTKEIDEHKGDLSKMFQEEKKLKNMIRTLEKDIVGVQREMQERDETMQDKEKRIYDLKKKNQELEKFKFVLDYKIKELKKQVEPREKDILGLTVKMTAMNSELLEYHKENQTMDDGIQDLVMKLNAQQKEVGVEKSRGDKVKLAINKIQHDLGLVFKGSHKAELKGLRRDVLDLYRYYCAPRLSGSGSLDDYEVIMSRDSAQVEHEHRGHLERSIKTLDKKVAEEEKKHLSSNIKLMTERVLLIGEINELKRHFSI